MDNKTQSFQFRKTKLALAVAMTVSLAACGVDGDEGSTTTSNTTSNSVNEAVDNTIENAKGKGSVQGTVLDTNGLPIAGATVRLAGMSATTDASGYYHFTDVPVTGVTGANDPAAATALLVTITGPNGYANATVSVTPQNIVLDSTNNGDNGNEGSATTDNDDSGDSDCAGQHTTWFDGFLAQAEVAMLPQFSASVKGVIRNCNTGAALPGVKLALDFLNVATGAANTLPNANNNVTIGVPTYTVTTGADGSFQFDNLPTDSLFGLLTENYALTAGSFAEIDGGDFDDATVLTTGEGIVNHLGDVNACMMTSGDNVAPYITSVNSSISNSVSEGFAWRVLGQGVDGTQGLVINFNEALNKDAIGVDHILVTRQVNFNDVNDGESIVEVESVVVAEDGMSMTVTLAEALPVMTKFSVWMPRHEYEDTSANRIVTGDDADDAGADNLQNDTTNVGGDGTESLELGIISDTINSTQFKTEYVRTRLCTYIPPVTEPGDITGEQLVKQVVAADDSINSVLSFWDNGGSATISNLNGQSNVTEALLQELWNRKNPTSAQTIVDNTAVITGTLDGASNVLSSAGSVSLGSTTYRVVVPNASHGQKVTLTPTAAFNIIGTPITVTLEDKVAPTTVIQDSYNYADTFNDQHVNSVASDSGYANGGELAELGSAGSPGSPILYVTPRLIAADVNNDDDAEFNNRMDVYRTLTSGNTLNGAATPAPYVTSTTNFLYDVNAIANWSAQSRTIGVAFSENINVVASQTPSFLLSSGAATSSTLSGFTANNSVRAEDYDTTNAADQTGYHTYLTHGIIQMTSNDIMSLANDDHNAVLNFTGAVSDTVNGNVAGSDSLVVIADAMPPLVTRAELSATTFTVTFNEPVSFTSGQLVVQDPDNAVADHVLNMTAAVSSNGGMTATWTGVNLPARDLFSATNNVNLTTDLDTIANFGGVAEEETVQGDFSFPETVGGDDLNHSILHWATVNDLRGNSWSDYTGLVVDTGAAGGTTVANDGVIDTMQDSDASTNDWRLALMDVPMYLATDTIVPFGLEVQFGPLDEDGTPGVDANFRITITATNPISTTNNAAAFAYLASTDATVAAEDGWRDLNAGATNVTDGWNLTEIMSHFRIIDSVAVQAALQADVATADGAGVGNGDGIVSVEEYVNSGTHANVAAGNAALLAIYDANDFPFLTGTTASFNADGTVLTIDAVVTGNSFTQSNNVDFIKITPSFVNITGTAGALTLNGANIIAPGGDDVDIRYGHVESEILGTNNEEQSQSVRREF